MSALAKKASARSSTPKILFEGQVIVFSYFDNRKISEGFVQVFSKKALSKLRETRVPLSIQTENSVFNENFAVFAENEQNAFYILTPPGDGADYSFSGSYGRKCLSFLF